MENSINYHPDRSQTHGNPDAMTKSKKVNHEAMRVINAMDCWKPTGDPYETKTINLKDNQCKWPLGEVGTESFVHCGREKEPDEVQASGKVKSVPYCEHHMKMSLRG